MFCQWRSSPARARDLKRDSGWVHAGHAMNVCPRTLSCHTIAIFSLSSFKHNPTNSCVKYHVYLAARC